MNNTQFNRELFRIIRAWENSDEDHDTYNSIMQRMTVIGNQEQWQIIIDTMDMIRDPFFITGEASLDTPVTRTDWESESE